jgi:hypothetical protein
MVCSDGIPAVACNRKLSEFHSVAFRERKKCSKSVSLDKDTEESTKICKNQQVDRNTGIMITTF